MFSRVSNIAFIVPKASQDVNVCHAIPAFDSLSQRLISLWLNLLYRLSELQPEADEPQAQPGNLKI
jgi:hypothetical protein